MLISMRTVGPIWAFHRVRGYINFLHVLCSSHWLSNGMLCVYEDYETTREKVAGQRH